MTDKKPVDIDGLTGELIPLPPKTKTRPIRYRAKLDTIQDIRREMSKVYRESRSNVLDISVASKLSFMLSQIGKVIEASELEKRVEQLEKSRDA